VARVCACVCVWGGAAGGQAGSSRLQPNGSEWPLVAQPAAGTAHQHWQPNRGGRKQKQQPFGAVTGALLPHSSMPDSGRLSCYAADETLLASAAGNVCCCCCCHGASCRGIVLKVLFHPKQLLLFSSCDAGEVRVWDLVSQSPACSTWPRGT